MNQQSPGSERNVLLVSAGFSLLVGIVATVFTIASSSQAILLDGLFNLSYFATSLLTLKVSRLVLAKDDDRFPEGYAYFEPLINGIKGMLVLGITASALLGAVDALFAGGRSISPGLATIYGLFATTACWTAAKLTRQGARRSGSPLALADAENWVVNAAISSAVLLAFVAVYAIQNTPLEPMTPYVDPVLVISVCVLSISVPVRMSWQALMELLNRAPSKQIVEQVEETVKQSMAHLPIRELFVRVVQPGRTRMILVHVVLPPDYPIAGLPALDEIRTATSEELKKVHPTTVVDLVFTAERKWGAPCSVCI